MAEVLTLAVLADLEIFRLQICNVSSFSVRDHGIHLHQRDRDAHHVILVRRRRGLSWCFALFIGGPGALLF